MGKEGTKVGLGAADVAILIAAHAVDYTKHVKTIRKTVDEIVNNSDVYQDDDELFFPMAANEVWAFLLIPIIYGSEYAMFHAKFTAPSEAVLAGFFIELDSDGTRFSAPLDIDSEFPLYAGEYNSSPLLVWGLLINGATAGNLQFQWAQYTAHESDTIVRAKSLIMAWKIA